MAGPCTRRNVDGAPTNDSGTPKLTPAISRTPTPAPAQAQAPASASVLGLPGRYTDKDLQRATKLALELFVKGHKYGQANSAPQNRAFKARNLDFYYENSHMECYYFCQQYEDYFDTAGATGHKRVPFAALLF